MGKLVTGVSTDLEFLGAINDKGAELTANATPEALADALDSTGENVSYNSTNEHIIAQINAEVPKETFTLTYDVNGGTGEVAPVEAEAEEEITLDDGSKLTAPEGKTFDGWSSTKDDDTTKLEAKITIEEDTTIYALWKDAQENNTPGE